MLFFGSALRRYYSYPVDSRCTIKPRSAQAEALILGACADAFAGNT